MSSTAVRFSDLSLRLDAEYYKSDQIAMLDRLSGDKQLSSVLSLCNRGKQPIYSKSDTGYFVLKTKDVDGFFCKVDKLQSIVEKNYKNSPIAHLRKGDVVINSTGVGSVCRPAIWYSQKKAIVDGHVSILRPSSISSELLFVYLLSDMGQELLEREVSGGTGQIELYPQGIQKIKFPSILAKIDDQVKALVESSYKNYVESRSLADNARSTLEKAVNIKLPETRRTTYSRRFSDIEERLDASYYDPVHKELRDSFAGKNYETLDQLILGGSTGKARDNYLDNGVPILKVRNVRDGYIDFSNTDFVPKDFLSTHKRAKLSKYDIIITSTGEGSIGKVDWFVNDIDCAIVPELTRISPDPKKIWPGYLYMFLRSDVGKTQFMREISKATGQTHLYLNDYRRKLRVPIIDDKLQKSIHDDAEKSINKNLASLKLMEQARALVNGALLRYRT